MSDYSYCRSKIQIEMASRELDRKIRHQEELAKTLGEKQKEFEEKMNGMTMKNLEILGFFTAVISFTIGSLELARGQTVFDASRLVLVLLAGVLAVFSCYSFLLNSLARGERKPGAILVTVSLVVIGGMVWWISM